MRGIEPSHEHILCIIGRTPQISGLNPNFECATADAPTRGIFPPPRPALFQLAIEYKRFRMQARDETKGSHQPLHSGTMPQAFMTHKRSVDRAATLRNSWT